MIRITMPSQAQITAYAAEHTAQLVLNDPLFSLMPIRNKDVDMIRWSVDEPISGLQQLRGIEGTPSAVNRPGANVFVTEPGYYGEFIAIQEAEMLQSAGIRREGFNLTEEVNRCIRILVARRIARIRQIGWNAVSGTFSVAGGPGGGLIHRDQFNVQALDASSWGTASTMTPLLDFRAAATLGRGKGVNFGRQARAFMNRVTANKLMACSNAADLAGKRVFGGNTVNSIANINAINLEEDVPQIVVYDEGYYNESETWVPFVPDNRVAIFGFRQGMTPAEYWMTRNIVNSGQPGAYSRVQSELEGIPPKVEVHDGHNGGPVIHHPNDFIWMDVS